MGSFKEYYLENKLLVERLSMAKMVMNDLESVVKRVGNIDRAYDVIEEYMKELGGVSLGSGMYSNVYEGKDGGGYVVKTAFGDNHLDKFLKHAENSENPLVPNVIAKRKVEYAGDFENSSVDIYIMEKLEVDANRNKKFFVDLISIDDQLYRDYKYDSLGVIVTDISEQYIDIEVGKKMDEFLREEAKVGYEDLYRFGHLLYDVAGNFKNDIHIINYGFDTNGKLVIFDPLSHSKPTYDFDRDRLQ